MLDAGSAQPNQVDVPLACRSGPCFAARYSLCAISWTCCVEPHRGAQSSVALDHIIFVCLYRIAPRILDVLTMCRGHTQHSAASDPRRTVPSLRPDLLSDSGKCGPRLPCIGLDMSAPYLREARRHLHGSSRLKLVWKRRNDRAKATDPHPQDFAPLAGSWLRCHKRLKWRGQLTTTYVSTILLQLRNEIRRPKAAAYGVNKLPLALAY